jgi:hypothetical protein
MLNSGGKKLLVSQFGNQRIFTNNYPEGRSAAAG